MTRLRRNHHGQNKQLSMHVDPISPPARNQLIQNWLFGGGAGYRPRVRNIYYLPGLSP